MSLLPGLRDLRAPVAAGLLWMAVGWLWWSDDLPSDAGHAEGLLRDVYELGSDAGRFGVLSAGLFIAYLLGILTTGRVGAILRLPVEIGRRLVKQLLRTSYVTNLARVPGFRGVLGFVGVDYSRVDTVFDAAYEMVIDQLGERYKADTRFRDIVARRAEGLLDTNLEILTREMWPPVESKDDLVQRASRDERARRTLLEAVLLVPQHTIDLLRDMQLVPHRIVDTMTRTFDRYDQLRGEAEFREAIGVPLLVMPLALATRIEITPIVVASLMLPGILVVLSGISKSESAQLQLLAVVRSSPELSTVVERLREGSLIWTSQPFEWRPSVLGTNWSWVSHTDEL